MKNWKSPPEDETEDTAPLFAKMERMEGLALRVVEDEGDSSFSLLSLIVGWMVVLQKRIGVAERWNRRAARKEEMLGSEALRMNVCDRLGGVEALERWEERARERLAQSFGSASTRSRVGARERGVEGRSERVREFALARMPGARKRTVTTRIVRAAPKHETPISVWPCEVMPERFAREWWKAPKSRPTAGALQFPASEPEPPSGLKTVGSRNSGGPGLNPGAVLCAFS